MNDPSTAPDPSPLARVRDVAGFLERMTGRSPPPPPARPLADRVTLDLLGLGVEQAYAHLLGTRPDLDAFAAWGVAAAGPPDPVRVARSDARVDCAPVPAEAACARSMPCRPSSTPTISTTATGTATWCRAAPAPTGTAGPA